MSHYSALINPASVDVTQLRVSRYHHEYPTSMSLSQDPSLWKKLIKDLYNKFSEKVRVAEMLDKEKEESLYRVCAATPENTYYTRSRANRQDFTRKFAVNDKDRRTPDSEFDLFVSSFLRCEFRSADIDTQYCVMTRERGGLPFRFPQKLVELCRDTLALVDFMEISARIPFTSDLNRLLRNFCYHVLVKDKGNREIWERHGRRMSDTYSLLRGELDNWPHKYGVIRTFLRTPQYNNNNVDEVIKRYLMSTAFLNIVLREAPDQQTARKTLKGIKEAVEEVDACQRGMFLSEYSKQVIADGICGILMKGIRLVLQAQCVRDAQIRSSRSERQGDDLKLSLVDDSKQLAREGRKVLTFGRKEKVDKWVKKVQTDCGNNEVALVEAMGLTEPAQPRSMISRTRLRP